VHIYAENQVNRETWVAVPLQICDSLFHIPFKFSKQSLDIDITTILLKYRPAVHGIPAQLTTDFNVALYAGWRHDFYQLKGKTDPLGRNRYAVVSRGYDFGFFAGTGTTYIDDNTMLDPVNKEYSGMLIQFGMAGFLESSFASFGIASGFDYCSARHVFLDFQHETLGRVHHRHRLELICLSRAVTTKLVTFILLCHDQSKRIHDWSFIRNC